MNTAFPIKQIVFAGLLQLVALTANAAGTFRFLTTDLPEGSISSPYSTLLLTANASGPVEFTLDSGTGDSLPDGLTLNKFTGEISGKPTISGSSHIIIEASDGADTIVFDANPFYINNAGASDGAYVSNSSLLSGREGVVYMDSLMISGGTGPFVRGVEHLPAGLSFNAENGDISGTPTQAGNFNITFTVRDNGEAKTVFKILPLTILPLDPSETYNFQFETTSLVNGEVGTAYSDTYVITDEEGTVTFSASGLPEGLLLDSLTGIVSGIPEMAGTYAVSITANDSVGSNITTNLSMVIAPSSSSNFYWSYFGIPAGIVNQPYSQTPNIHVTAANGATVTYVVDHLPPGLSYDSSTGEISGTPTQIGIYPVTFMAIDTSPDPDEDLILQLEFVIFPSSGGDANRLPSPLWASKLAAKVVSGSDNDSWSATYIYNDDRTTANFFNPAIDEFQASLGNSDISLAAGAMVMDIKGNYSYTSPKGISPAVKIKGSTTTQTLSISITGAEIGVTLPTPSINNNLTLGTSRYRIKGALNSKGQFIPTESYRNTSFVLSKGTLVENGTMSLTMLMTDPSFEVALGDTVTLTLYRGANLLLSKDITSLVTMAQKVNSKTSRIDYSIVNAKVKDPSPNNILAKMAYTSSKGALTFSLTGLLLADTLNDVQEHLGVELVIGNTAYATAVTFFETQPGSNSYTTTVTAAGTPPF